MWESPQWEKQDKQENEEERKEEEGEKEEEEENPLQKNFVARRNNFPLLCTALTKGGPCQPKLMFFTQSGQTNALQCYIAHFRTCSHCSGYN